MQGQAQPPSLSYIPRFSWRAGTSPVCELGLGNGKLANEASWFWVKRYRGRDVLWRRTLIVLSFSLLLFPFDSLAQTVSICSRTDEIQAAILSELPSGTNCDSVTSAQLAGITSLVAGHNNISMLRVGDFSGLTGLENLDLFNIQLTTLPEKLFDGLTSLENLWLYRSSLTSLPEKLFDGLTSLENLRLNHNSLNNLPEGLFDGLTSLEDLVLHTNALTSLPGDLFDGLTSLEDLALNFNPLTNLPEDLFDGLTSLKDLNLDTCPLLKSLPEDLFAGLTRLENLKLSGLTLTSLPDDLFDGLTSLEDLDLSFNLLTSLPGDLFDEPTSLEHLWLNNNSLTSLPENLFAGLTSLEDLALSANSLTSLPENLFNGLTSLEDLALSRNSLTSLPENLFNGLTSLEHVGLYYNSLTSLPEGLFVGLTSLEDLRLFNNSLTSLPEDLFDGLSSLEYLYLSSNSLTSLEEDLFDGLTSLARLRLNNNSLTSLPANLFDHVESPQALSVRLGGNSIACLPAAIVNNSAVTITPEFNVCGIVTATLLLSPASISENGGSTTVTATLDHVSSAATTVTISATPVSPATGSDYKLSTNTTLTIAAGETTSTGTVTITAVDNDRDDPDKTITVSGAATSTETVTGPADVTLTIEDDEDAPTVTLELSPISISENGGSTMVTATLDHASSAATTVTISATPVSPATGSDYKLSTNTTLTIAAGETTSTGTVTITAVDNDRDDPDKTITVSGAATSTETVTGPADVTLTIEDDEDAPTVTLELSPISISENGGSTTVTATLDHVSSAATTVTISATPVSPATGSDYKLSTNTTLTIAAGETTSTGTVTITAVDNDRDDPDKTITVSGAATSTETVTGPADVTLTIEDDEDAPTVTLELSPISISENGGSTMVTATLDHASSAATTVTISATPVSPATGSDYKLSTNTTLTIAAGETTSTGTVTITAVDNDRDDPDKTITVSGAATSTETVTGPADVTLTIEDDEDAPTVTLELSPISISENGGSTTVTATLDHVSSAATTVTISATPVSPATGSDYKLSTNTTLTIAAGETTSTGTVTITAVDNDRDDPDKTITVSGAATSTETVTGPADVTLTIEDDEDAPTVTLELSPISISENGGSTTVTATLDHVSSAATTVTISATPVSPATGSDYKLSTNTTLTIAAGETESRGTVTITAVDNDRDEPDKIIVASGSATNTQGIINPSDVMLTIADDDRAAITAPVTVVVPEGGSSDLSVALSSQPTGAVTVMVTGHAGTDLIPNPPELTFSDTDWNTTQSVTLTAALDEDITDDQVTLALTASGGGYTGVTHSVAVTITDNDVAAITAPASVVVPEGGSGNLQVSLSSQPTGAVTVMVTGHAGTDLTPNPPELIFSDTNWNTPQSVTLTAAEDADVTDDQVVLTLTASGGGYAGVTHSVAVTITDNDVASIAAATSAVVPEGSSTDLPVALSAEPTANVTLTITGHAGTDLTPNPRILTFTPANWGTPQPVTLTAAEDADVTDDQVVLTLTASGGGYAGVTHSVAVTITDNDVASIAAATSAVVPEGSSTDLPVALSAEPTANVTLTITGHAGTDLTPNPRILTFTPANWGTPQPVTLTAAEDADVTDDQVALTLTASGGGYAGVTHSVAVTITDNDVASIAAATSAVVPEGSSTDLPVALSAEPTANVTLTITGHAGTDLTPNPRILTFTPANWGTPQPVTLTAAEDEDVTDDQVALTLTASGGGYAGVTHSVAVTITDNDLALPFLSIHDLQIREDAGTGQMRVELSRPSDEIVVVQFTTSDGTAETPSDYVSSQGYVVFSRNATKGVISVEIVDDASSEGEEQLAVTLLRPRNATIQRGVGTLTIVDDDGGVLVRIEDEVVQESVGMVQFTVHLSAPSSQPISVSYRTRDGTAEAGEDYRAVAGVLEFAPGAVVATIAVPLLRDDLDWREETFSVHLEQSTHGRIAKAVAVATIREAGSVAQNVLAAYAARFVRSSSVQVVKALQERFQSGVDVSVCGAGDRADLVRLWQTESGWRPSLGELLGGCHVARSTVASGGIIGVWGRGAFQRFRGQGTGALRLRGSVSTGLFGMDYRWDERWMAGLVVAHSRGAGSFAVYQDTGMLSSGLTGVYPFVAYQHPTGGIWVSGGYGRGRAEGMDLSGQLTSGFGALGIRGSLVSMQALRLSYHGDAWYADVAVSDLDVMAQVYQTRLGMEALLDLGDWFRPYVEANVRRDGGSAETGLGMELGGGVRVSVPAWHLKGEVHTRALVLHAEDGFTEWGISGSVQFAGGAEKWMLRVRPSWGTNQGLALYHQQTVLDAVPVGRALRRTEMELGYGIPIWQGMARSVLGATWQSGGALMRLGGELHPRDRFTVAAYGLMHTRAIILGGVGLNLRGSLRY